ncbi:MAG: MerR family transcriptional regulator [Desulfosalsimonadaceae bacterium]
MQIGEIAEKAGTSVRTVRYYMEEGFIEAADRSPGGFYLFTPETAETVFYIQKLKNAGLALKDIKSIYEARRNGQTGEDASSMVIGHLERQKALVTKKIADYQRLHTEIEAAIEIASRCRGCSIQPTWENCKDCKVLKGMKKFPLPLQAIL